MAARAITCCTALFVCMATTNVAAQRVGVAMTRQPGEGGSFLATALGATAGGLVGLGAGIALAPAGGGGDCALGTGGGCSDGIGGAQIAFIAGSTVLGATAGAWTGRRLSGGRQSPVGSLLGACVGLLAGGWLGTQLRPEEPVPAALIVTIPTGIFAALGGW
jgi:hypothetical protein